MTATRPPLVRPESGLVSRDSARRCGRCCCVAWHARRLRLKRPAPRCSAGGAKEAAVLAALQLLNSVFERDTQFVGQVKESSAGRAALQAQPQPGRCCNAAAGASASCCCASLPEPMPSPAHLHTLPGSYEPLDAVLRHERQRIPLLLDYVRYPHNPALQVEALRAALHLTQRLPNLVSLLLTAPTTGAWRRALPTGRPASACLHPTCVVGMPPVAASCHSADALLPAAQASSRL